MTLPARQNICSATHTMIARPALWDSRPVRVKDTFGEIGYHSRLVECGLICQRQDIQMLLCFAICPSAGSFPPNRAWQSSWPSSVSIVSLAQEVGNQSSVRSAVCMSEDLFQGGDGMFPNFKFNQIRERLCQQGGSPHLPSSQVQSQLINDPGTNGATRRCQLCFGSNLSLPNPPARRS